MSKADRSGDGGGLDEDDGDGGGDGDGDGYGECKFDGEIFFFFFRLVGILDPQWHFGSTLANLLVLQYFAHKLAIICRYEAPAL